MIWKRGEKMQYFHKSGLWMIDAWVGCMLKKKVNGKFEKFREFSDVDQAKVWVHDNGRKHDSRNDPISPATRERG